MKNERQFRRQLVKSERRKNAASPVPRTRASTSPESPADQQQQVYPEPPVGVVTLDRQGRITELNATCAGLLGFSPQWLVGKAFVVFVARQDVQRFLDTLRSSSRKPGAHTIDLDLYVGIKTLPIQISISTSTVNNQITHRLMIVDISNAKVTETSQESLSNWYLLLHNSPDIILTIDPRGRIHFINKPLWGYSVSAFSGTNIFDYIPESEYPNVTRCLAQSFRFKRSMCDVTGINQDFGRWYNFSFGTPHPDVTRLNGTTITTVVIREISEHKLAVIREISEHKLTEERLRASGEQLRDFAAHVEAVREEERTRVAREIHDELGQALTALKLDLAWVEGKTGRRSGLRTKMREMIGDVDSTIERVRRISSELRPAILDDLGLVAAIEWQLVQFRRRTKIRTELSCAKDVPSLRSDEAAAVFRVVQEALTNVMRHSKASKVSVSMFPVQQGVRFTITDNGKGLNKNEQNGLKSLGIVGMRERISRLGGEFKLSSEPGKGTRLDFVIPTKP